MSVAIDCEMVASGNKNLLAKVSIVDSSGRVLYNEYVKPTATVTDYRTFINGITKDHLESGKEFSQVQSEVSKLIKGKILVGHSLDFDLKALGLCHPEVNRRDLAKYRPFMKTDDDDNRPHSLRDLAQKYLKKTIQDGAHDSVTDAQTAMQLYNLSVAIDCEMVASGNKNLLAKVSIVDSSGRVLYNEYVKPTATVTDYKTFINGITKDHLESGKEFRQVQSEVSKLIKGKILVGHSLDFDLKALGLCHPEVNRRDLAKYRPFMKTDDDDDRPHSLRDLAQKYLKKTIQDGAHDSVTDAQTAMQLYNLVASNWNSIA